MLFSSILKQRSLKFIALSLMASSFLSCKNPADQSASENEVKATDEANAAGRTVVIDPNFCNDVGPGRCFTHVLLVPERDLINDIGLSMLAFASSTARLKPFIDKSCQEGLTEFWIDNAKMRFPPRPLRHAFAVKVQKMRCIVYPMRSFEDENFEPKLHPNEIGMVTRLTKFEIEGKEERGQANLLVYKKNSTTAVTSFRSVKISAGSAVGSDPRGWQMLNDLGMEAHKAKGSFGRDVSVSVNMEVLKRDLAKIDLTKPVSNQGRALNMFFKNAQNVVMSGNPLGASIVLLGMGYQAFKSICGTDSTESKDADLCTYAQDVVLKTGDISKGLSLPTSDENEMLRMAIIRSVNETMTRIFEIGQRKQIEEVYKL